MAAVVTGSRWFTPQCEVCDWRGPTTAHRELAQQNARLHDEMKHPVGVQALFEFDEI